MKKIIVLAALAVVAVFSGCVNCKTECTDSQKKSDRLQIGWAKRSIAMPGTVPIPGQTNMRVSIGEYSPVYASALAMSNSKDAAIFVSVDVVSVSNIVFNNVIDTLKKEAPAIPAEKIIKSARTP